MSTAGVIPRKGIELAMPRFHQTDRTAWIAKNLAPAGTLDSPQHYFVTVQVNPTSTAAAATNWRNPHANGIAAKATVFFDVGGTGTFDVGTSSDGTGANAAFIDGGTMVAGWVGRYTTGTDGAGTVGESGGWLRVAGSGSSGDSVVLTHNDTPTSTAVAYLIIEVFNPVA